MLWQETSWDSYYKLISPFVIKIVTNKGTGTGLIAWEDDSHIHIVTALHVVKNCAFCDICFYDERYFTCSAKDALIRAVKLSIDLAIRPRGCRYGLWHPNWGKSTIGKDAGWLRKSKIPLSLTEAKKRYSPCFVCEPPE